MENSQPTPKVVMGLECPRCGCDKIDKEYLPSGYMIRYLCRACFNVWDVDKDFQDQVKKQQEEPKVLDDQPKQSSIDDYFRKMVQDIYNNPMGPMPSNTFTKKEPLTEEEYDEIVLKILNCYIKN